MPSVNMFILYRAFYRVSLPYNTIYMYLNIVCISKKLLSHYAHNVITSHDDAWITLTRYVSHTIVQVTVCRVSRCPVVFESTRLHSTEVERVPTQCLDLYNLKSKHCKQVKLDDTYDVWLKNKLLSNSKKFKRDKIYNQQTIDFFFFFVKCRETILGFVSSRV